MAGSLGIFEVALSDTGVLRRPAAAAAAVEEISVVGRRGGWRRPPPRLIDQLCLQAIGALCDYNAPNQKRAAAFEVVEACIRVIRTSPPDDLGIQSAEIMALMARGQPFFADDACPALHKQAPGFTGLRRVVLFAGSGRLSSGNVTQHLRGDHSTAEPLFFTLLHLPRSVIALPSQQSNITSHPDSMADFVTMGGFDIATDVLAARGLYRDVQADLRLGMAMRLASLLDGLRHPDMLRAAERAGIPGARDGWTRLCCAAHACSRGRLMRCCR